MLLYTGVTGEKEHVLNIISVTFTAIIGQKQQSIRAEAYLE